MNSLPPGSVIGIIGGGQLGRMLALAAATLGYKAHIFAPERASCAADVAWRTTQAAFDDHTALADFARKVDVVTFEFENVAVGPLAALGAVPVYPPVRAVEIAQDRAAEKQFAQALGATVAPWMQVPDRGALDVAIKQIGTPSILKTTRLGYDGKGQARLKSSADVDAAWAAINEEAAILESLVAFECEFSLIVARARNGDVQIYPPSENVHRDGVLETATAPASVRVAAQVGEAAHTARAIAHELNYVGVFAVEYFCSSSGPVFNEMAPRVHNSGHWTIEGAEFSQFENHIRAICGLPLGSTSLTGSKIEMTNLIGNAVEDWPAHAADPVAHVHIYGKGQPSPGRKMGHVTRVWR
jgi:5-(carboxyamino)imidazole ribonucleotide synthase